MTDAQLLDGVHRHDEQTERAFDDRFRPIIAKLLTALRISAQDVDDLTQRTLLKALVAIRNGNFHGDASLKTWVTSIALNEARDYWRSLQRSTAVVVAAPVDMRAVATPAASPETRIAVEDAIASLRPRFQTVLQLWAQGWTANEMAKVLRLSPGRTGAVVAEAKEAFRQALRREGFGPR